MPCKIRSYVSSKVIGNSSRALRILEGMHRRRVSSWQNTQRNLSGIINNYLEAIWKGGDSHALSALREYTDNEVLIVCSPSPHCPIIHDERADKAIDVFNLATFVVKVNTMQWGCQGAKSSIYVLLRATSDTDG